MIDTIILCHEISKPKTRGNASEYFAARLFEQGVHKEAQITELRHDLVRIVKEYASRYPDARIKNGVPFVDERHGEPQLLLMEYADRTVQYRPLRADEIPAGIEPLLR